MKSVITADAPNDIRRKRPLRTAARIMAVLALGWFWTGRPAWPAPADDTSRLIVYDQRGVDAEETVLIFDQRGSTVTVWMRNDLGRRTGEVPLEEYRACFDAMRRIPQFALKSEYHGRLLRAHAARGTLTLAWKNAQGREIKTIRYYAPEHTLDDFRRAFNSIWGLSRYAILSLNSLESPKLEYREDAVYFLSGAGWLTSAELDSALDFHRRRGRGERVAKAVWSALDQAYPAGSEFSDYDYRAYCVRKSLIRLGATAAAFLQPKLPSLPPARRALAEQIIGEIRRSEASQP